MRELGCVDDAATGRVRSRALQGLQGAAGRLVRLSPAPAAAARRTRRTRTSTRRSSPTSRGCSRRWTGCAPSKRLRIGRHHPPDRVRLPDLAAGPGGRASRSPADAYLQQAAYVAWKSKRVRGLSFYQWDDEPVVNRGSGTKRYSGWQTGLRFNNGKPKPVLSTMPAPFVIERQGRAHVRAAVGPGAPGRRAGRSTCRSGPSGAADFRTSRRSTTAADGTGRTADDRDRRAVPLPLDAGADAHGAGADAARVRDRRSVEGRRVRAADKAAARAVKAERRSRGVLHRGLFARRPRGGPADGPLARAGRAHQGGPRRAR